MSKTMVIVSFSHEFLPFTLHFQCTTCVFQDLLITVLEQTISITYSFKCMLPNVCCFFPMGTLGARQSPCN